MDRTSHHVERRRSWVRFERNDAEDWATPSSVQLALMLSWFVLLVGLPVCAWLLGV